MQEESDNLHILQRDKEDIESALDELKRKFATNQIKPDQFVATKKIQRSLEVELSKVHHQLAINSRVSAFEFLTIEKTLLNITPFP